MSPVPLEATTHAVYYDGDRRVTKEVPRCQKWLRDRQCRAYARGGDPDGRCPAHRHRPARTPLPETDPPAMVDAASEAVYAHARALHRLAEALDRLAIALTRAGGETGH
jgi:hypothetical protein